MQLSTPSSSWHAPKSSLSKARLYLGVTSIADLNKATHVCEAVLAPSINSKSASIAFSKAAALPTVPKTVTLTGANAVFEDIPHAYLLSGGRVRLDSDTTLGLRLDYDTNVIIDSVSIQADWRFPYTQHMTISVVCGAYSSTVTRLAQDVVFPKKFAVAQTSNTLQVTIAAPAGELTLIDLLPSATAQTAEPPTYGLLIDTVTGSVLALSGLTYFNSTPYGFDLGVV